MAIEKERFDQILAIVHANLVDGFQGLAAVPKFDTVHGNDVSDYGGDGCLLAGANVTWSEMEEFAEEFTSRYKVGDVSPHIAKLTAEMDAEIQSVIDDILQRAEKYGFTPNEDTARELISESSSLLGISLHSVYVDKAVGVLLEQVEQAMAPSH